MVRFGDEKEGFSVDSGAGEVFVSAWGFWSIGLALELGPALTSALREQHRGGQLCLDVGRLRPLRDEAQEPFARALRQALVAGAAEIVIRSPSALTKLQMLRLARELGKAGQVRVE